MHRPSLMFILTDVLLATNTSSDFRLPGTSTEHKLILEFMPIISSECYISYCC
jgi:hypothetical protein